MRQTAILLTLGLAACQAVQTDAPAPTATPTDGWIYRAPEADDDTGNVYVTNERGVTMSVSCGNSGIAGITLEPDPRPAQMQNISKPILVLRVDNGRDRQIPATCGDFGCSQDPTLGGEPFPPSRTARILRELRAGNLVDVSLGGEIIQSFTLKGSSRAIGAFKRAQGRFCDGL